MKNIIIALSILIIVGLSAFYYGKSKAEHTIEWKEIRYTQEQIDSLKSTMKPIEKEVIVYRDRWNTVKEEEITIEYPEECDEIVDNLKEQIDICEDIVDSQDEIIVIQKDIIYKQEYIINNIPLPKPKPFGVGIQVGATTDFNKIKPYIGVGVSYNIIRF